jgi:hypothetical protein
MARCNVSTLAQRFVRYALISLAAALVAASWAPSSASAVDGALARESGAAAIPAPRAFGAACAQDADCDSSLCRPFRGHTVQLCTRPCTVETQAEDCPTPLTSGYCSRAGYCRF